MDSASRYKTLGRLGCSFVAAACLLAVVVLLLILVPMLRERSREAFLRAELDGVRATGRVYSLRPEDVETLVNDPECRNLVTEVLITGDFADINDKRFHALKQLPKLKAIDLEYVGCVDDFLEGIQGAKSLEEITLHRAGVSDKAMHHILSFPNLKRLAFDERTPLSCLQSLKGNPKIESLGLYEYDASADDLRFIKSLPNLRKLSLELDLKGSDNLDLRGLSKLEELDLGGSLATDSAINSIRDMTTLTTLRLDGQQFTDAGLRRLNSLKSLKKLHLGPTRVTRQGIIDFKKALPDCEVEGW
jgi:Leucine-rich repeat (LRR) protein